MYTVQYMLALTWFKLTLVLKININFNFAPIELLGKIRLV